MCIRDRTTSTSINAEVASADGSMTRLQVSDEEVTVRTVMADPGLNAAYAARDVARWNSQSLNFADIVADYYSGGKPDDNDPAQKAFVEQVDTLVASHRDHRVADGIVAIAVVHGELDRDGRDLAVEEGVGARGQDGAGIASIKIDPTPGLNYIDRERRTDRQTIQRLFAKVDKGYADAIADDRPQAPFAHAHSPSSRILAAGAGTTAAGPGRGLPRGKGRHGCRLRLQIPPRAASTGPRSANAPGEAGAARLVLGVDELSAIGASEIEAGVVAETNLVAAQSTVDVAHATVGDRWAAQPLGDESGRVRERGDKDETRKSDA